MIGTRVAHYEILEKLGEGGMGVVWKARDTQLDRDVALKVLRPDAVTDAAARARLLREARTASKLNHPHICTIHEAGESDGLVFIVMELVEGRTLSARLAVGPLAVEEVLRFGLQLADALAHAHKRGIVHRDLKSVNVVVTSEGRAKVLDFGLAKRLNDETGENATTLTADTITGAGAVAGTLAYMAPEQLRGQPADTRSDIWALGVMLYEMTVGVRPFAGHTGFELSSAILSQPPPPLPVGPRAPSSELEALIRRCLEKDPAKRYQTSGEVVAALEAVQSGGPLPVRPVWQTALSRRRWLVVGAPLAAGIGGAVALDLAGVRTRLLSLAANQRFHSVAVLPFTNLSGDPAQEYFADGITDSLITDISKIGALKVISRTSVMQYKGAKKPLPEIARALKVETVLEGSVVRDASRVRVAAQLIEAAADRNLWADSFERELSSILALLSELARAIAREVRARLTPQQESRLGLKRQVNPAAYEAYLRGMHQLHQGTPDARQKGIAYLLEAVDKDPADPLVNARLAGGYLTLAHGSAPPDDALPRAKAAVRAALNLDSTLAEAIASSGMLKGYDEWDWEGGVSEIQRALDLSPSMSMARYHLAWFYLLFNRASDAIAEHRRAQELDPFRPLHTAWLGEIYRMEGRFEEAIREARKSLELNPKVSTGHFVLSRIYQDMKMFDEAIGEMQKAAAADPSIRWALASTYAMAGRTDEARRLLAELNQQKVDRWIIFWRTCTHAALGDKDEAFRLLDYERPHIWTPWLTTKWGNWMRPLRSDPRFLELTRRMNVPKAGIATLHQ